MTSGRKFVGAIRSLVIAKSLQLRYVSVLYQPLLIGLRGPFGIRRMDRVPDERKIDRSGVMKDVSERLMKVFYDIVGIYRDWGMMRLLRCCQWQSG